MSRTTRNRPTQASVDRDRQRRKHYAGLKSNKQRRVNERVQIRKEYRV